MEFQTDTATATLDAPTVPTTETEAASPIVSADKYAAIQDPELRPMQDRWEEIMMNLYQGKRFPGDIEELQKLDQCITKILCPHPHVVTSEYVYWQLDKAGLEDIVRVEGLP